MHNNGVAFEIVEEDKPAPPGYHKVAGYLVFDVKMVSNAKPDGYWMRIKPLIQ